MSIRRPPQSVDVREIGALCALSAEDISGIQQQLAGREESLISAVILQETLASFLDPDLSDLASLISSQIISLRRFLSSNMVHASELVDELIAALRAHENKENQSANRSGRETLDEDRREVSDQLEERRSNVIALLEEEKLRYLVKAIDLNLESTNLVEDVSLITDIRPVLDDEREEFLGGIITQRLKLSFLEHESSRVEYFGLDMSDVRKLRDVCDDAIRKADLLKNSLSENHDLITLYNGGEEFFE